ncbi:MAG: hypothetical protein RSF87_07530 [Cellulosilyticaceae bacterium]
MKKIQPVAYQKDEPFYTQYWFWVIIMIIVICLTNGKKTKIIICGNGNGSEFGNPLKKNVDVE